MVRRVRWKGTEILSKSELQGVAFTHPPDWQFWKPSPEFSESTLRGDMERIADLYRQHGYYEARTTYKLDWNDDRSSVEISITIQEGLPIQTKQFQVTLPPDLSAPHLDLAVLTRDLPLVEGERFSAIRYVEARAQLLIRMGNLGYPAAKIEGGATVDVPNHSAIVNWNVEPGPLVEFGPVRVQGLYKVSEETVMREVHLEPNERYSTLSLERLRLALQRQGLYRWVGVKSSPPPDASKEKDDAEAPGDRPANADLEQGSKLTTQAPDPQTGQPVRDVVIWPVDITLAERPPYRIDLGIGYGSDEDYRGSFGWQHRNFFGDDRDLRFRLLFSGILWSAGLTFTQPYFFDPKLTFTSSISVERDFQPSYDADRLVLSAGLSRPLGGAWRGRMVYEFTYNDITQTSFGPGIVLDEPTGISRVAGIEFGVRRQTLDDLLDPTRGTWLDLMVKPAFRELGGTVDFVKLAGEIRAFQSWGPVTFAARLHMGVIQPLIDSTPSSLPLVVRFQAGGSNSNRGFQYHRMPPTGADDIEFGGTSLLESSFEVRFPLFKRLRGVFFVDAGELSLEPFRWRLGELFWAVGPGLRYDTIVGPIRFDFGTLLNPPTGDSKQFQWFLSVGQTF